jgi:hypothetical protein
VGITGADQMRRRVVAGVFRWVAERRHDFMRGSDAYGEVRRRRGGGGGKVDGRGGETAAMRCGVEKARGSMTRGGEGAPRPREWRRSAATP